MAPGRRLRSGSVLAGPALPLLAPALPQGAARVVERVGRVGVGFGLGYSEAAAEVWGSAPRAQKSRKTQ